MSLQTKSLKTEQKITITTLLTVMILAITGCGSLAPTIEPMALLETQHQPQMAFETSVTRELDPDELIEKRRTDAEPVKISRRMGTVSSGATLAAETILIDPLIRPVSTVSALFSLSVKSVGGFLKRNTVNAISFRVMENTPIPALSHAPAMDLTAWEKDLDEIVRNKASMGSIDYLVDGEEYFARLIESIANAEQEIDLRTYIFDNDDVGVKIADLLKSKAEKLDVRILVDGLGDLFATNLDSETMPEDFVLPGSISSYLEQDSNVRVRKQSNPWLTGDHVKTTIIDQKLAFIGGMNIGREYRYDWHDLMMAVEGPIVKQLRFEFDKAWDKSSFIGDLGWLGRNMQGYDKEMDGEGYPIRVLSTNIHNSEIYRAQVEAIRRARSYIYIENAYFSDDTVLYELARARRRGVDVRVIMPSSNDSGTMDLSNDVAINRMLRNGIRVYAYPGMTHVKAAIYDGWACLGSANFDKLSLKVNKEINLGTSHPEAVNRLMNRVFIPDFAKATELHEAKPIRWTHHLAEFISDEML